MHFMEIASRLTGFSTPIFGISWEPPESERAMAKRVIAFLEDRRVLYNPSEMEIPAHCVDSVLEIRRFLTHELGQLETSEPIAQNLQAMRAACRRFLDQADFETRSPSSFIDDPMQYRWSLGSWRFLSALGELRTMIGLHLALIAVRNGLDIESDLATIVPAAWEDEPV